MPLASMPSTNQSVAVHTHVAKRQPGRIFARNALLNTVTPMNRQEEGFND
jgi:hypothetical protein